ncbi:hypothetical protein PAMP_019588 [Pampus punctatissimus]
MVHPTKWTRAVLRIRRSSSVQGPAVFNLSQSHHLSHHLANLPSLHYYTANRMRKRVLKGVGRHCNASLETRGWLPWKPQAESSKAGRLREKKEREGVGDRERERVCDEKIRGQHPEDKEGKLKLGKRRKGRDGRGGGRKGKLHLRKTKKGRGEEENKVE